MMKDKIFGKEEIFIIAELSANHNGDLETALETIRAAKRSGANGIKIQTYTADTMTINSQKEDFLIKSGTIWDGQNLYSLYEEAYTPWEWHSKIFECAKEEGLICFSSPFDTTAVDFLEELNTPAYKIASFEITDIPLIEYVASKGKPIIISTGIAELSDIELAISTCKKVGNSEIALLKCTSSYPAPIEEANISLITEFKDRFGVVTGLSDHTLGDLVPIVAASQGARIIEKHFIIDRSIGGPDSSFSMNEKEFKEMVDKVRLAEKALGSKDFKLTEKQKSGKVFSRSLYIVKDVKKGEVLDSSNVRSIRPGFGLHPKEFKNILGKKVKVDLERGDRLSLDHIQN